MKTRILIGIFLTVIFGLIVWNQIESVPASEEVLISDSTNGSHETDAGPLSRGEVLQTSDEYLEITLSDHTRLWLGANTRIELHRIHVDETVIRFTQGRILLSTTSETPVVIETNHTEHRVHQDTATFVNYDFLETVHVIPLTGTVQTYIEATGESLSTPVPLSIHETDPVSYEPLEVSLSAGDAAAFYAWTGLLTAE